MCSSEVLGFYDVNKDVLIRCDASKEGLGAVLYQAEPINSVLKPIAFASRALNDAEKNYAPIE